MLVSENKVRPVLKSLIEAHPHEEPEYNLTRFYKKSDFRKHG